MPLASTEVPDHSNVDRFRRRTELASLLVSLSFTLFILMQLIHHEMWRDELNVFGIAKASPDLRTLFNNIRYEGHPCLWYVLVWLCSKWVASPIALKVVQGLVSTAIILVIGMKGPFSMVDKVLLLFSYFLAFEYTVISRMYGLCFLLMLAYIWRRVNHSSRTLLNFTLLGLIANTDVMGLFLSSALAVEYLIERSHALNASRAANRWHLIGAGLIYAAMLGFMIWTVRPASDISWRTTGHPFSEAWSVANLAHAVRNYLVFPWFPLTLRDFPAHYWKAVHASRDLGSYVFIPILIAAYWSIFRRERSVLIIALTSAMAILFGHLIFMGSVRHFGITFMAFVAALWMQVSRTHKTSTVARALLALSAAGGLAVTYAEWTHPFSNAGATARWLKANHLDGAKIVGSPDTSLAGVAEELGRPVYFLDCSCSGTFLHFSKRRDAFDESQIPTRVATATQDLRSADLILITVRPLSHEEIDRMKQLSLYGKALAHFEGAEEPQENFFVYEVHRRPAVREDAIS